MSAARRIDRITAVVARDSEPSPDRDQIIARIDKSTGWLIVDGRVSRGNCVQQYSDGVETWGELRLVEDVYTDEALATMHPRPIVDAQHTWVTADNFSKLTKGSTGPARVEGDWCVQPLAIQAADMVAQVVDGEVIEISLGYEVELVEEPGEHNGVPYRYRQTNPRMNHAALGPRDWARAGPQARLIFDASQPIAIQQDEKQMTKPTAAPKPGKTQDKAKAASAPKADAAKATKTKDGKILIGDVEYDIPDEVAAYIESLLAEEAEPMDGDEEETPMDSDEETPEEPKTDRKGKKAKGDDRAQATADAFERYRKDEAKRIDARARLVAAAREVLGRHANLDGKPAIEIHKMCIDRLLGADAPKLAGKSAEYVEATFDHAMRSHSESQSLTRQIGYGHPGHADSRPTLDSLRSAALKSGSAEGKKR